MMNKKMKMIYQWLAGLAVIICIAVLAVGILARPMSGGKGVRFGVTFSQPHATGIGLDWKKAYEAILDDLGVRELRLVAYWNVVEPADDQFDWSGMDWQMDEAAQRGAKVVLAVGRKVPRWPECFEPEWSGRLTEQEKQEQVLEMLEAVVERYLGHEALAMWQLENEPFLDFGICPPPDARFLEKEENLIRTLDKRHPILITDSGELNWWLTVAKYGDVVGTTMYRTVFSERTEDYFHYDYLFPAGLYRAKTRIVGLVRGKNVLVAELQGEPWGAKPLTEMSPDERHESLSPERLGEIAQFARRTGLSPAYWWGVEYWYWEKERQGDDSYWRMAKEYF